MSNLVSRLRASFQRLRMPVLCARFGESFALVKGKLSFRRPLHSPRIALQNTLQTGWISLSINPEPAGQCYTGRMDFTILDAWFAKYQAPPYITGVATQWQIKF